MFFKCGLVAVVIALMGMPIAANEAESAYDNFPAEDREIYVEGYRKAFSAATYNLKSAEANLKAVKKGKGVRTRNARLKKEAIAKAVVPAQEAFNKAKERHEYLKRNDPPFFHHIGFREFKTGRYTTFVMPYKVMQIIDDNTMLVTIKDYQLDEVGTPRLASDDESIIMLDGISTADVVVGRAYWTQNTFMVLRTETYETPLGATNTVFILHKVR